MTVAAVCTIVVAGINNSYYVAVSLTIAAACSVVNVPYSLTIMTVVGIPVFADSVKDLYKSLCVVAGAAAVVAGPAPRFPTGSLTLPVQQLA